MTYEPDRDRNAKRVGSPTQIQLEGIVVSRKFIFLL